MNERISFEQYQHLHVSQLLQNLAHIREEIQSTPDPYGFESHNEFMHHSVRLMNCTLYLLKTSARLTPNPNTAAKGFTRQQATVVGHMVRIAKLYEGFIMHVCSVQFELAVIFSRLIYESEVKMQYLMEAKSPTFRNFRLISYRSQQATMSDLLNTTKTGWLESVRLRIIEKVRSRLKETALP